MGEEAELQESSERAVEPGAVESQGRGHACAAEKGGAVAVGGECEEHEHRDRIRTELGEPALVQEPVVEPAEAALWRAQEPGMGRRGRRPLHSSPAPELFLRFFARCLAFSSVRSLASLAR